MTPSQRIEEIKNEVVGIFYDAPHLTELVKKITAIIQYLDEEYKKNQPCKHESSYRVEGTGDVYYNVCNDCGVLFLGSLTYQVTKK